MPTSPANLIDLDYRAVPPRRVPGPIVDIHSHVYATGQQRYFREAADLYGITKIVSMTPLEDVPAVREAWGERIEFIAIPRWKDMSDEGDFLRRWQEDLAAFRDHGARLCKLWMAPRMRKDHGLTAEHPVLRPVIDTALDLGFDFMIHAGDPTAWFSRADKYADAGVYGTKRDQYDQVHWLADYIAPRTLIGAHMGGTVEDLDFLQSLLDQHGNYSVDSSATKWIVREVARQPRAVHAFIVRNADRVLFGSDLVVHDRFDNFDHYASRYWCHQMMWESDYDGRSPIEDPDGADPPRLAGVQLPDEVLVKLYHENASRLGYACSQCADS